MDVSMIKIGDLMIVTIHSDLSDIEATNFKDRLAIEISEKEIKGVIIDISYLEVVDSFIGRILGSIVNILKVMDTETVIVGIKPEVAITIIELGLELKNIHTEIDVEKGMDYLKKAIPAKNNIKN